MLEALALPALAALLQAASAGADVGLRLEGRSTTLTQSNATETRGAYAATPSVSLRGEAMHVQLLGNYRPELWVSDLERQHEPLQMHRADVALRLSTTERWAVTASAYGSRGQTDPLAAFRPGSTTAIPQTTGYSVEDLRLTLRGEYGWSERSTLSTEGSWQINRAVVVANRTQLPTQRALALDTAASFGLTERDTLRLNLRGQRIETGGASVYYSGLVSTAVAWTHQLTPALGGHAGAGLSVTWSRGFLPGPDESPRAEGDANRPDLLPNAEAGLTWTRENLTLDVTARLTTQADRYTGYMRPTIEGVGSLRWQMSERWSSGLAAFGSQRTTGDTTIAGGEAHLTWTLRTVMAFDLGARARRQHERNPLLPSYTERAVFLAMVFQTERFLDYQGGP